MAMIFIVLSFVLLIVVGPASATPEAGHWRRETPLGVSGDSYLVWVSRWDQDGSNHECRESVELQRRLFADNSVAESDTLYSAAASNIDAPYDWDVALDEHPSLDLSLYLRERQVSPIFAGDWLCDCTIVDGALVLKVAASTAVVLSPSELRLQVPSLGRDPKVVGCWHVSNTRPPARGEYWMYAVRFNSASWDDDWSEFLVVVPGELVLRAADSLRKNAE